MSLFSHNEYIYPLLALMYSWKKTQSKYPYYLLVTPNISAENKEIVQSIGFHIIETEEWQPQSYKMMCAQISKQVKDFWQWHGATDEEKGWRHTFTKFKAFGLTQFDKILLLDCDILILKNVDDLFEYPSITSVSWWKGNFCSGCLLFEPNQKLWEKLEDFSNEYVRTNQGFPYDDYMILKDFFTEDIVNNRGHLIPKTDFFNLFDFKDNPEKSAALWQDIRIIHMTGQTKPWRRGKPVNIDMRNEWGFVLLWHAYYLQLLNNAIKELQQHGFNSLSEIDYEKWD